MTQPIVPEAQNPVQFNRLPDTKGQGPAVVVSRRPVFSPEEVEQQRKEGEHFEFVNSRVKDLFDTLKTRPEATEQWKDLLETHRPFVEAFLELAETPDKHQWNIRNLVTTIENHTS